MVYLNTHQLCKLHLSQVTVWYFFKDHLRKLTVDRQTICQTIGSLPVHTVFIHVYILRVKGLQEEVMNEKPLLGVRRSSQQ